MSQPEPLARSEVAEGKWGAPDLCFRAEPPEFVGSAVMSSSLVSWKGRWWWPVG